MNVEFKFDVESPQYFDASFQSNSGSGATSNYNSLTNKPKINGVELIGDKPLEDFNIQEKMTPITNSEIDTIIFG